MNTEFEWEPGKAQSNLQKHGVSFAEAATVFFDPLSITVTDPQHSVSDDRFIITGLSYSDGIWWSCILIAMIEYV
jgi:uncharacterized DUF497 family protein